MSESDNEQSKCIKNIDNVYKFSFDASTHGTTMDSSDIPWILGMDIEQLKELYCMYYDKIINREEFGEKVRMFVN